MILFVKKFISYSFSQQHNKIVGLLLTLKMSYNDDGYISNVISMSKLINGTLLYDVV